MSNILSIIGIMTFREIAEILSVNVHPQSLRVIAEKHELIYLIEVFVLPIKGHYIIRSFLRSAFPV